MLQSKQCSDLSPFACRAFFKTYKDMSSSHQATLCNFYTATRDTSFVEKARVCPSATQGLKLQLTPVGEPRLPTTVFEMKVSNCPNVALIRSIENVWLQFTVICRHPQIAVHTRWSRQSCLQYLGLPSWEWTVADACMKCLPT